jgi:hypothetical protein
VYTYVCGCVGCMYICVHVCVNVCIEMHMCLDVHACIHDCMNVCMQGYMIHACVHWLSLPTKLNPKP